METRAFGREAHCQEMLGRLTQAGDSYLKADLPTDALRVYRQVPNIQQSLQLLTQMPGLGATALSLKWIKELQELSLRRPGDFNSSTTLEEKEYAMALVSTGAKVGESVTLHFSKVIDGPLLANTRSFSHLSRLPLCLQNCEIRFARSFCSQR